jgi:integrase
MEEAQAKPADPWRLREIQFRDGLTIAILTLWPIRRRSLAALTITRHLTLDGLRAELRLFPEDTKSKRAESWVVPEQLLPYLTTYLEVIRPALLRGNDCGALWISQRGQRLPAGALYDMVIKRTGEHFGQSMSLHDFRRSAPTFLAMEAPEKVELIPGILQHKSADVGQRHYNLARSTKASRRHVQTVSAVKERLRSCSTGRDSPL